MIAILCDCRILIDEEDYIEYITNSKRKWVKYLQHGNQAYFARTLCVNGIKKTEKLHRIISKCSYGDGNVVDHINGDTLDLRKLNLRVCTKIENARNRKTGKNNVSGLKGVCYRKDKKDLEYKYQARIWSSGKNIHLGFYKTAEEAHAAYCEEAIKYHGQYARFA